MPKLPVDYSRVVIYKIEHIENYELVYVGNTTNFSKRKYQHKNCCNNKSQKDHYSKLYVMIRDNGGWDMFNMIEIKKFPCIDNNEARAEEERCRKELQATLNSHRAFISKEEKKNEKKEYNKKYMPTYYKQYTLENPDKIKQKSKNYYDNNKVKESNRKKEYYSNNKDLFKYRAMYKQAVKELCRIDF